MKKLFVCAPTANELFDLLKAYKLKLDCNTLALDWSTNNDSIVVRSTN